MNHVVFFDEYDPHLAEWVGGKCSGLGEMTRAGLPVPPGFAVTTNAYLESIIRNEVGPALHEVLAGLDVRDLGALAEAAQRCRQLIMDSGPAHAVDEDIRAAYRALCDRCGRTDLPVAVRSSATAEDRIDASFAGQQDTYLWVRGEDEVVYHVVRCWASLFTDRAIAYRAEHGYSHDEVAMSVAVQKMVTPITAGVAFTLDPTNGDRSKVVIDAAWGLGESVVGGEVTPDNFVVDKVIFEIVKRSISAKELETIVVDDEVHHHRLDGERSIAPSLTDEQVKAVARLAKQVERHFGRPQDIEWALDPDTTDGEPAVVLLQSRPETVWSLKPREVKTHAAHNPMEGVLQTLLTPIKVRPDR
jgi:pyruvate,water dikinase